MPDIGDITGTLSLNTQKFDQAATGAGQKLAELDKAIAKLGDSATATASKSAQLPQAIDKITVASNEAAAATAKWDTLATVHIKTIDEIIDRELKLTEALKRQRDGTDQSTTGIFKQAAAAQQAAKDNEKWGFSWGTAGNSMRGATGAMSAATPVVEKLEDRFAHLGLHAAGLPRQLASMAAELPPVALGAAAVAGGMYIAFEATTKAIEKVAEYIDYAPRLAYEYGKSSREAADAVEISAAKTEVIDARMSHDRVAVAKLTAQEQITANRLSYEAQDADIQRAKEKELGYWNVAAAAYSVLQLHQQSAEELYTQQTLDIHIKAWAEEQAGYTKMLAANRVARKTAQAEEQALNEQAVVASKAIASDAVHAEAAAATAKLTINKDYLQAIQATTTEKIRLANVSADAEIEAAKKAYGGQPELQQMLVDINRKRAGEIDTINAESADKAEQAARKVVSSAGDFYRALDPEKFKTVIKQLDISETASKLADGIKMAREALKQGIGTTADFADGVEAAQKVLRNMGATAEQAAKIVDEESKTIVKANYETYNSFANIDGVITNATGATKGYNQTISQVVQTSGQMTDSTQAAAEAEREQMLAMGGTSNASRKLTDAYDRQHTVADTVGKSTEELVGLTDQLTGANAESAKSTGLLEAGVGKLDDKYDAVVDSTGKLDTATVAVQKSMQQQAQATYEAMVKAQQLAEAYDKAREAAERLGQTQTGHSLDTSMNTVAAAASNATSAVTSYTQAMGTATGSTGDFTASMDSATTAGNNLAAMSGSAAGGIGQIGAAAGQTTGQITSMSAALDVWIKKIENAPIEQINARIKAMATPGTGTTPWEPTSDNKGTIVSGGGPSTMVGSQGMGTVDLSLANVEAMLADAARRGVNPLDYPVGGPLVRANLYTLRANILTGMQQQAASQAAADADVRRFTNPTPSVALGGPTPTNVMTTGGASDSTMRTMQGGGMVRGTQAALLHGPEVVLGDPATQEFAGRFAAAIAGILQAQRPAGSPSPPVTPPPTMLSTGPMHVAVTLDGKVLAQALVPEFRRLAASGAL